MQKNNLKKRAWARLIAGVLLTALIISDSSVAVLAEGVTDSGYAGVQDAADGEAAGMTDGAAGLGTDSEEGAGNSEAADGAENADNGGAADGAGGSAEGIDTGSPADDAAGGSGVTDGTGADEGDTAGSAAGTEGNDGADTVSDDDASVSGDSVSDDEIEEEILGYVEIERAHGETGEILRRFFKGADEKSAGDYYHKYYNQLGDYGKEVYDYLTDISDDLIDIDALQGVPRLVLNGGEPVSDPEAEYSIARDQLYLAVAAFDYDHPEIFWLNIDAFQFVFRKLTVTDSTYIAVDFDRSSTASSYIIYDTPEAVEADKEIMEENVEEIIASAEAKNDIYEKATVINDWLADYNYYNRYVSSGVGGATNKTWSSAAALTPQEWLTSSSDKGDTSAPVCEAYSRAFKMVCDRIGIPCLLAVGDSHMWDYIQTADGTWYAMDVTRNDPVRSDEYVNRTTPEDDVHKYIMVGNDTVVPGKTKSFLEDKHHPTGTYWGGGKVMPTPTISSEAYDTSHIRYDENMPVISDLSLVYTETKGIVKGTFTSDRTGSFYYVLRKAGAAEPGADDVKNLVPAADAGGIKGTGSVTKSGSVYKGTFEFSADDLLTGGYKVYLAEESQGVLSAVNSSAVEVTLYAKLSGSFYNITKHKNVTEGEQPVIWVGDTYYAFCDIHPAGKYGIIGIDNQNSADNDILETNIDGEGDKLKGLFPGYSNVDIKIGQKGGSTSEKTISARFNVETEKTGIFEARDGKYYTADKKHVSSGWQKIGKSWYYFYDGQCAEWEGKSGTQPAGLMVTGAAWINTDPEEGITGEARLYKFDENGVMTKRNWRRIKGLNILALPASDPAAIAENTAERGTTFKLKVEYVIEKGRSGEEIVSQEDIAYKNTQDSTTIRWETDSDDISIDEDGTIHALQVTSTPATPAIIRAYCGSDDNKYEPHGELDGITVAYPLGWFEVEGEKYYGVSANVSGQVMVDLVSGWREEDPGNAAAEDTKKVYYFYPVDTPGHPEHSMARGVVKIGGLLYRFGSDGRLQREEGQASVKDGFVTYDDKTYYYHNSSPVTGCQSIGDKYYGFASDGAMYRNAYFEGTGETAGYIFYADEDGVIATGFRYVGREEGSRYFADNAYAKANNVPVGALLDGRRDINGKPYYFSEMTVTDGTNGKVSVSGALMQYDYIDAGAGTHYYALPYGNADAGVLQSGWVKVGNEWKYFNPANDAAPYAEADDQYTNGWISLTQGSEYRRYYRNSAGKTLKGWQTIDGKKYYFHNDGYVLTELQNISGKYYYFEPYNNWGDPADKYGVMYTNVMKGEPDGNMYYFASNGVRQTGWGTINGKKYYFETAAGPDNGKMYTGFRKIGNNAYYFKENAGDRGELLTGLTRYRRDGESEDRIYYANASGVLQLGWQKIDGEWRYFDRTLGYEVSGAAMNEDYWCTVSGNKFYFKNGTTMVTGRQLIDGKYYYFSTDTSNTAYGVPYGALVKDKKDVIVGSNIYKADENGVLQDIDPARDTDCRNGFYPEGGPYYYYLNKVSTYVKGWQTIDGKRYYFGTDGKMVLGDEHGDFTIGSSHYRTHNGEVGRTTEDRGECYINNWYKYGENISGNQVYQYQYYNGSGVRLTGWQKLTPYSGEGTAQQYYYLAPNEVTGLDGRTFHVGDRYTGVQKIGNSLYLFDANGVNIRTKGVYELRADSEHRINPAQAGLYYTNTNGTLLTGWQKIDGKLRYFDSITGKEQTTSVSGNGFMSVSGDTYYFVSGTTMATGFKDIAGKRYYFASDGKMAKGWFNVGNNKYHADPATGELASGVQYFNPTNRTPYDHNAFEYYFGSNYVLQTGWQLVESTAKDGTAEGSRGWRYYDGALEWKPGNEAHFGARRFTKYMGNGYYGLDIDCFYGEDRTPQYDVYYRFVNNSMQKGWQTIDGKKYCFGTDGRLQTGIFKYGNAWYYTAETGPLGELGAIVTGLQTISSNGVWRTYYLDGNGKRLTGWQTIDKKVYYFNPTDDGGTLGGEHGAMMYGRIKVGVNWYFLDNNGVKQTNTFVNNSGETYYVNGSGVILKGWQTIKADGTNRRFYFDTEGRMLTGWQTIGNARYFLNKDEASVPVGAAITGLHNIGGDNALYYFNSNGVMQTNWQKISGLWYYFATDTDVARGNVSPDDVGKKIYSDLNVPADYWRTVDFGSGRTRKYYINKNTTVLKNWQNIGDKRYYFDPATGEMWTGTQKIGNTYYRLHQTEGYLIKDAGKDGDYFYNSNGQRLTGWQSFTESGVTHIAYFDPALDGKWNKGEAASDYIIKVSGKLYRLDSQGYRWTEAGHHGNYLTDKNGMILTGWQSVPVGDVKRLAYFDPELNGKWNKGDTDHIVIASGKRYRLDNGGYRCTTAVFDGSMYYSDKNGLLLTGFQTIEVSGKKYRFYFDPATCEMQQGWLTQGGYIYYLCDSTTTFSPYPLGAALGTGTTGPTEMHISDKIYYFNSSGQALTGWKDITDAGGSTHRYYFDPANGAMVKNKLIEVSGKRYFLTVDGDMVKNEWRRLGSDHNPQIYHFESNGQASTGWKDIAGADKVTRRYYFNTYGIMYVGLKDINGSRYFFHEGNVGDVVPGGSGVQFGMMLTGEITSNDDKHYFANSKGVIQSGWQKTSGGWEYFDPSKSERTNSLTRVHDGQNWYRDPEDKLYYMDGDKTMVKGFKDIKDPTENKTYRYYFGTDGILVEDSDNRHYITVGADRYRTYEGVASKPESYGRINTTAGFIEDGDTRYINSSGKILTGWQNIKASDGKTRKYYFGENIDDYGKLKYGAHEEVNNPKYYSYPKDHGGASVDPQDGSAFTGFRKNNGNGLYLYYNSGELMTGWQTIQSNVAGTDKKTKRKYRFDSSGWMYTGYKIKLYTRDGNDYYFTTAADDAANEGTLLTGYITSVSYHCHYYADKNGVIQRGWVKISNVWRYFSAADIAKEIEPAVNVDAANRKYWAAVEDQGSLDIYYINNNSAVSKGWQTIGGKKYYFDTSGKLVTDGGDTGTAMLKTSNGDVPVNILAIGTGRFVVYPKKDKDTFVSGDRTSGMAGSGFCTVSGSSILRTDGTYYFGSNGQMLTGWQTIDGKKYYFNEYGIMLTGPSYVGSTYYLFDADGRLQTNNKTYNLYGNAGSWYYPDKNGVMQKGWQKLDGKWYFFDTATGRMKYKPASDTVHTGTGIYAYAVRADGWMHVSIDGSYETYYTNGSSICTGFKDINGSRYYFLPGTGLMLTGDFKVGNDTYLAESTGSNRGRMFTNHWDMRTASSNKIYYYNDKGVMLTGWKDIGGRRYYFDFDGRMALGIQTIGGKRYLFSENGSTPADGRGELVKNRYYESASGKYLTDGSGVLLTGWQYFTHGGVAAWHYFDPETGAEIEDMKKETEPSSKGEWIIAKDGTKYYNEKNNIVKGWKTIDGKKYYFDPVTGEMRTGLVTISGKVYCLSDDGVARSGKASYMGTFYYLDGNSALRYGWISASGKKYYTDPSSGELGMGFVTVGGKNYYFNEEEARAGEMSTDFFSVPNLGQSYYKVPGSNSYYADTNGVIHKPGWDVISLKPANKYQRKWSYYFDPNEVGQTASGEPITGMLVKGNAVIKNDGSVRYIENDDLAAEIAAQGVSDAEKQYYYRFDPRTGARAKAVLIFYGNYYGESDVVNGKVTARFTEEQVNTFASMSAYMNPDWDPESPVDEGKDIYVVNSADRAAQDRLYNNGQGLTQYNPDNTTFPMAASDHSKNSGERKRYVAGNDIARSDGNVDVYDVEAYSWDVYTKAMSKYGANNLVLMGTSSGGGICAGLCMKAAMLGQDQPANTILLCPWVDAKVSDTAYSVKNARNVDPDTLRYWGARYTRYYIAGLDPHYKNGELEKDYEDCPSEEGAAYYFASPVQSARRSDAMAQALTELQNVTIYAGSNDPCYPDSKVLYDMIKGNGGNSFKLYSGQHAFMFYNGATPNYGNSAEVIHNACWQVMCQ